MGWTKEQQEVIELRNKNILVAAAAGSGKTAVLVERIIQRILDKNQPVDIDTLLIVTFTSAAAGEMRERISGAIEKALESDPENTHLQKQATLVHNAQITTIHSFCLNLIRNYFHRIDLEPNFRIAEEAEINLLKEDVLEAVFNRNYEEKSEEFIQFVECFATGKHDRGLQELVTGLYFFAMSYPWPEEWLDTLADNYKFKSFEEMEEKPWMQILIEYIRQILQDVYVKVKRNLVLSEDESGPDFAHEVAKSDEVLIKYILEQQTYSGIKSAIDTLKFDRMPVKRNYEGDLDALEEFKANREIIRKEIKKIKEQYFFASKDEILVRTGKMYPVVNELVRLTKEFLSEMTLRKREKNILDFNDLEHLALEILIDKETKQPTEVARDCRKQFAEVMTDEYQDSNLVQESLLYAVSKEEDGAYNRFMVGDVKQSIYRFRLARPEIFMEKYDSYTSDGEYCRKVELRKNFRSRNEVLEITNDIFYKIMQKDLGNVAYNDDSALYCGANYVESMENEPEILLADSKDEAWKEADLKEAAQIEAEMVAARIRQLMKRHKVTDKGTGELRPIKYSDIVILMRSFSNYGEVFLETLGNKKIPAHALSKTGYFEAIEVQTVLNYLRILDNPRQDIPLTAVLRSVIGNFTDEELAWIRATGEDKPFHVCVLYAEESESLQQNIKEKICLFLQQLRKFRKLATELPIHELLYRIFEETGYAHYVSALPGGGRRKANLEMLLEKAVAYEKTSYKGLFHFIRYIDRLRKYEVDYGEAEIVNENADAVRIVTIHKSKGLEFPVVFLCGTGRKLNKRDSRSQLVVHSDLGIGVDYIDPKLRLKGNTLYKKIVAKQVELEGLGEELRVLYVALTRAKEKLIITGVVEDYAKKIEKMQFYAPKKDDSLSFMCRSQADCYLDWILPAIFSYDDKYNVKKISVADLVQEEMEHHITENIGLGALLEKVEKPEEWADTYVKQQLSWEYPYEIETSRKSKYSVSELKHRAIAAIFEEEEREAAFHTKELEESSYIPKFAGGKVEEVNPGALRGSAMHRAMECLPVEVLAGNSNLKDDLNLELEKLIMNGKLSEDMYALLRKEKLIQFYESELALRMKNAALHKELYIEKPFVMGKKADEIENDGSNTRVLIQGIIDAFFVEEDGIVLLDYKTDVVKSEKELVDRYKKQMELYQEAIEGSFKKNVKEKLMYSFYFDKVIYV